MALRICAILCLLFISAKAAPSGLSEEYQECHTSYSSVIDRVVEEQGSGAVDEAWRLIFYDMDLDGNGQVTAPEVTLYLEKERFVHETDIMEVMRQAARWVATADGGDDQLSREEFVTAVEKSMGEQQDPAALAKYEEVSTCMCQLFTNKVPHIAEVMEELSICTETLEKAILEDITERAEFNSWTAIFRTMDKNEDRKIDFEELKAVIEEHLSESDDLALASALGHAIYGELGHDVYDISEKNFYVFVHELLYGLKETARKDAWEDVISEKELRGRTIICKSISEVRDTLSKKRNLMDDCIKAYERTRQSVLGADGVFAPEIVFTLADENKDGDISQEEFDRFIGSSSTLYHSLERGHAKKGMKFDEFRPLMPDEIVVAKERGAVSAVLESSALTAPELGDAEKLCSAIIDAVQKYPGSPEGDHEMFHFPSSGMSFLSQGEHILVEHPFPGEDGEPPSSSPGAEIPSDGGSVVYHIKDSHGLPYELTLNHKEVDDITHRILIDQQPMEPVHHVEPHGEAPIEHTGESPSSGSQDHHAYSEEEQERLLIEELQKMLHIQAQEEAQAAQPHREEVTTSQAPTVTSEEGTEGELDDLVRAIESFKIGRKGRSERS